jgi:hypothetical protein
MDPYLENPRRWPGVHHRIISAASDLLTEQLQPKYYVGIEERVYISGAGDPARPMHVPDLHIAARSNGSGPAHEPWESGADVAEPVAVAMLLEDEIHEPRLEIVDSENRVVVDVIEVLSPANKVAGARGRVSFEEKRQEVWSSTSHWVEIDLLRAGICFAPSERFARCEYRVYVSDASKRPAGGLLWPIRLRQRLPVVRIPLKPEDPPVPLDLQAVLNTVYDRGAYHLAIDYRSEPVPPLSPEWSAWADHHLREKGLRP